MAHGARSIDRFWSKKLERIDAHQHYWTTARDDYSWLTPALGSIYRDFLPDDLAPLLNAAGINRTILVQAAATEAETLFLLDIAKRTPSVGGVVGWVDLEANDAPQRVEMMAANGVLGLRPMVQDIQETEWLLRPALRPGLEAMIAAGMRFDALIQPRHLPVLLEFSKLYPALKVIIDHGAKPDIARNAIKGWAVHIERLATETPYLCKVSGLLTEAREDWVPGDIRPYVDVLLAAFGPERLVWGSDWPVLNLASDYATWERLSHDLLSVLSDEQRAMVFGRNAARFYGI